jgi:alpha-glucosidase
MTSPHDRPTPSALSWWRDAVVYQVYLRSFADANADGIGDIVGLRSRLDYLRDLGVDALWVNPWYASPLNDGGYDVADYRQINADFGTLDDAVAMIAEANGMGLRVLVDLVPNHTSTEHRWFQEALAASPGSEARARYHFRPGRGMDRSEPPNNWTSVFGGSAWSRIPDGEWYLHLFDRTQPDLNWDNAEVRAEFRDILRFWLDLGAAGFRVDVAHGLGKDSTYPDLKEVEGPMSVMRDTSDHPYWDRPALHDVVREWREILDEYPGSVMVAEAWVADWNRLAAYLGPDEYHQVFNFHFLQSPWVATRIRESIAVAFDAARAQGALPTWVLSNHDVVRHPTRYGLPQDLDARAWLLDGDRNLLDSDLGLKRARAAILLMLGLPGSAYLYQGEELGLPEVHDLPLDVLDDPVWEKSGHTLKGRDGSRVPIPWTRDGDSFGFGADGSWLPQPEGWGNFSHQAQAGIEGTTLELYRSALRIRRELRSDDESLEWLDLGPDVVGFRRGNGMLVMVNLGPEPVEIPEGETLISSADVADGLLPADTAIWVAVPPNSY